MLGEGFTMMTMTTTRERDKKAGENNQMTIFKAQYVDKENSQIFDPIKMLLYKSIFKKIKVHAATNLSQ